jgi:hypothetical protein
MTPNEDVIQDFGQFKNIFGDLVVYSPDTCFLYNKFSEEVDCLLQLTRVGETFGVYLHGVTMAPILEAYLEWFTWVFSVEGP